MRKLQLFQPAGLWLVVGAAALWGTIGVATQGIYHTDHTTPLFINLTRMLIAAPVLLVACWRIMGARMFHIQPRHALILFLNGTFLAISQAAYFAAIQFIGITIATLLTICIAPLLVTALAVLLKLEPLTWRNMAALVFGITGSVLLVGFHPQENAAYNLPLGVVYSLVATVCYASAIVCGRFLAADYHPLQVTSIAFAAGALVLTVINLLSGVVIAQTPQSWLLILYLGLVPTALAYWLFQTGLRSISAAAASIISMLDPVVAALLAWVLFGETFSSGGIVGAGLLLLSIFLLTIEQSKEVENNQA